MSEPTRVYIAAPWKCKEGVKVAAGMLRSKGYNVVSTWHDNDFSADIYEAPPEHMKVEAERDMMELMTADVMLYLNLAKSEGKATELGMALMDGIPIYCVGGKQGNVFLHLDEVMHIDSVEAFFDKC